MDSENIPFAIPVFAEHKKNKTQHKLYASLFYKSDGYRSLLTYMLTSLFYVC